MPTFMGIVNITPNSFSDTAKHFDPHAAIQHALQLARDGATILDLGAEASSFFRPGVEPVPPEEQLNRLLPVLHGLAQAQSRGDLSSKILISIDTRSAKVARETLAAGAHIINDISAGTHDPELLPTVARAKAAIILMHMERHFPQTPTADDPHLLPRIKKELAERIHAATNAGIPHEKIALDPGIGFGKTMADNWRLTLNAHHLAPQFPIVLGISRKRFLETLPPPDLHIPIWPPPPGENDHPRDAATALLTAMAVTNGVPFHRVHNVSLAAEAIAKTQRGAFRGGW